MKNLEFQRISLELSQSPFNMESTLTLYSRIRIRQSYAKKQMELDISCLRQMIITIFLSIENTQLNKYMFSILDTSLTKFTLRLSRIFKFLISMMESQSKTFQRVKIINKKITNNMRNYLHFQCLTVQLQTKKI